VSQRLDEHRGARALIDQIQALGDAFSEKGPEDWPLGRRDNQ